MPTANHLRLIASRPAPRTFGEGYIDGYSDGHLDGRNDGALEMLAVGFVAGALIVAALAWLLR
jgi:hypothetical protein